MMIQNVIYAFTHKDGFENKFENKRLEMIEQIGRFGSIAFMMIQIPGLTLGYWFSYAPIVYFSFTIIIASIYCFFWICFWKEDSVRKALALSILPAVLFLFSGLIVLNIPLVITAILFSYGHIKISYYNAVM